MATSTTQTSRTAQTAVSTTEQCNGCGCSKQTCTCCELTCFERPDYHCGHLLTDADLSLQVRYVVEKNKLRNRALHGHGVVCGLGLTCDPDCEGHILVHEGYAIDDCGNDIVVCETRRFDVIGALKAKNLIAPVEECDPCQPELRERDCCVPQCFYVTISYVEQESDFQTPFQASCASGPQDCVPTRIKELYRLDVSDTPPSEESYLTYIEAKLKRCFRLFIDSPVGRLIAKNLTQLKLIAAGKARQTEGGDCELFCLMKAQFQQQLKQHPDQLTCNLAKEVACLACPDEQRGKAYAGGMQQAFETLMKLMLRYQYDCVLSDLVFNCVAPKEGGPVLLGCVEVDDCCVLRVSNTHRRYVWSFANIVQVLMATVMASGLDAPELSKNGELHEPGNRRQTTCCDDAMQFDVEAFLGEFEVNAAGRYLAASAPVRALRAMKKAMGDSFAFQDSAAYSPELFAGANAKQVVELASRLGVKASLAASEEEIAPLNPLQAMLSQVMLRRDDFSAGLPGRRRDFAHCIAGLFSLGDAGTRARGAAPLRRPAAGA